MAVPHVWVVASHRELKNPSGHDQIYTVMDEAGQRTLLNRRARNSNTTMSGTRWRTR
jgi:hypothetical protein